ncbi:protein chibby homolog 1 isoform X2 [Cimex lectularius]|uniref:Uncharacterized protein n=1 Tax=Cimex lectularius TaxID=79782 RepID=A0A8I6RN53_CIMLE|nr:protein chibby homolog 1 isoform X2 [Cimex lectularius]
MPLQLFSNKFQHPKPTPRKKLNFHSTENKTADKKGEKDTIIIKLGENSAEFMKGEWMSHLQEQAQQLKEENNLLTMKVEVLLDMLTQATAMCNKRKKVIRELQMFITSKMGITDVLYKESDSEQTSEDSSEAEEDQKLTDEEKTEEEEEDECSDSIVNKYQLQKVTSAQTVC